MKEVLFTAGKDLYTNGTIFTLNTFDNKDPDNYESSLTVSFMMKQDKLNRNIPYLTGVMTKNQINDLSKALIDIIKELES